MKVSRAERFVTSTANRTYLDVSYVFAGAVMALALQKALGGVPAWWFLIVGLGLLLTVVMRSMLQRLDLSKTEVDLLAVRASLLTAYGDILSAQADVLTACAEIQDDQQAVLRLLRAEDQEPPSSPLLEVPRSCRLGGGASRRRGARPTYVDRCGSLHVFRAASQ